MASFQVYDSIVVGLGGHGSATIAELARRGQKVLGLEQFNRIHAQGSSHGKSRVYRQAYFEDPKYVPLLKRSFDLWKDLHAYYGKHMTDTNQVAPYGTNVFTVTGAMMIGRPDSHVVAGTLKSIQTFGMPHEVLSSAEVRARFPVYRTAEDEIGLFETDAGYLNPEACIDAYFCIAESHGAELRFGESMLSYNVNMDKTITIVTTQGEYTTRKLVLSVGAWAPTVYGDKLAFPLLIERRVLFWFKPKRGEEEIALGENFANIPVYIWDLGESGNFYGFPEQPEYPGQVKVAMHYASAEHLIVRDGPESLNRNVEERDVNDIRAILKDHMPSLSGEVVGTATCMYTTTPDGHFLIDFDRECKDIVLASPCSGHGFKFCSVIGEIIADLVIDGSTQHDISIFKNEPRIGAIGGFSPDAR